MAQLQDGAVFQHVHHQRLRWSAGLQPIALQTIAYIQQCCRDMTNGIGGGHHAPRPATQQKPEPQKPKRPTKPKGK